MPSVETPREEEKKKKKRGGILLILLSVVLIVGGISLGVYSLVPHGGVPSGAITAINGAVVIPDDPSATSSAYIAAAQMVADDGGLGFRIPAVDLDVPLGSINSVNGVMNPPNFSSVFWIRNLGVSVDNAAKGTVYIVAHSLRYGTGKPGGDNAPGNFVQSQEKITLKAGDPIEVDGLTYSFVEAQVIPQNELGSHTDLWDKTVTGRLIFVTCLEKNDHTPPTDNIVIIGKLVS